MSRLRGALALSLLVAAAIVSGCSKEAPPPPPPAPVPAPPPPPPPPPPGFKVTRTDLGKAVGIDKQVAAPTRIFSPKDTIYLSVVSDGATPSTVLRARWTFGPKGILVKETTETIATVGPRATEFHIDKPSGWPPGTYKVELFVNDQSAGISEFEVATVTVPAKKK
jgi:hypothetical protein